MKKIRLVDVFIFIQKFMKSAIAAYSGQTAFFLMLSFFPFLMFFFSFLRLTSINETDVIMWAMGVIPEAFMQNIQDIIAEIYNSGSQRMSLSIIMALILSSKAFISIQQGLNALYETKESRNFIMVRVFAVLYSFVFAILLLIVLGFLVFGNRLSDELFKNVSIIEYLVQIRMIVLVPVMFFFFMVLYYFVPNKKQKVKNQIPGAAFASMGWLIFSYFFSLYVDKINKLESFYGAMTTMALMMLWLYGCMYVLFIGGLINKVLEEQE